MASPPTWPSSPADPADAARGALARGWVRTLPDWSTGGCEAAPDDDIHCFGRCSEPEETPPRRLAHPHPPRNGGCRVVAAQEDGEQRAKGMARAEGLEPTDLPRTSQLPRAFPGRSVIGSGQPGPCGSVAPFQVSRDGTGRGTPVSAATTAAVRRWWWVAERGQDSKERTSGWAERSRSCGLYLGHLAWLATRYPHGKGIKGHQKGARAELRRP